MARHTITLSGRGDMGSLTDTMAPPRFSLRKNYRLVSLRVKFYSGSGSATLTIKVDHRNGALFDRTLWSFDLVGSGGSDVDFRVTQDERDTFTFYLNEELATRDEIVLTWTDPDGSKATQWAVDAELDEVV